MRITDARIACASAALLVFTGCATPRAALDQANNGAALTLLLQGELQKFRSVQRSIAEARIESIRRQRTLLATYESASGFDDRVLRLSGKGDALALYASLKGLSDSRLIDEQALKARLAELDESFTKLLAPLPDSTEKLAATQQALAALGEELSARERIELASTFAQKIKKSIDDNKKKMATAAAATPVAPAQLPASVPTDH